MDKGGNTASTGVQNLPEDVINEILLRLPVNSLLKFKVVCKYWYTLIKSPNFISKHCNHRPTNLLVHHYIRDADKTVFSLFPDETLAENPPVHRSLDYLGNGMSSLFLHGVYGPFNGLFLLQDGSNRNCSATLWNPATREFRHLPVPGTNLPPHFRVESNTFGFGWDPLTNEYKVIWIQHMWDTVRDISNDRLVVALYTLGNDSWRYLDPNIPAVYNVCNSVCSSTTYVNGAYYWVSRDFRTCAKIVLFDMSTEEFREIQAPEDYGPILQGDLVLHNNCIAMFVIDCEYPNSTVGSIDLWVMEPEGFWTKHLTVGPLLLEVKCPLGFWKNDEIFLETNTSPLVLYNLNTRKIRSLGIQGDNFHLWAFRYKESLVSVKGANMEWDQGKPSDN